MEKFHAPVRTALRTFPFFRLRSWLSFFIVFSPLALFLSLVLPPFSPLLLPSSFSVCLPRGLTSLCVECFCLFVLLFFVFRSFVPRRVSLHLLFRVSFGLCLVFFFSISSVSIFRFFSLSLYLFLFQAFSFSLFFSLYFCLFSFSLSPSLPHAPFNISRPRPL